MKDKLDMNYINSLPLPIFAKINGCWWPVYDIDVETGLLRSCVCGIIDVVHISDVMKFRDDDGKEHESYDFYSGAERNSAHE